MFMLCCLCRIYPLVETNSLTKLIHLIQQTSTFPEIWKQSHVTHKNGSRSDIENYRPVSILIIASKILERCIFIPLYRHLEPSFSCYQYGFRKKRSSIIQLIVYLEKVYKALEQGQHVDVTRIMGKHLIT